MVTAANEAAVEAYVRTCDSREAAQLLTTPSPNMPHLLRTTGSRGNSLVQKPVARKVRGHHEDQYPAVRDGCVRLHQQQCALCMFPRAIACLERRIEAAVVAAAR